MIEYGYALTGRRRSHASLIHAKAAAVLEVARQMKEAGQIVSFEPYSDTETYLVFRESALRTTKPLDLFAPIQSAAWEIVTSRGRR